MALTDELRKKHEELLQSSREAMRVDRARKEAFQGLVKHPGWKVFQELLNSMANERGMLLLSPAGSVDNAIVMEFVKGSMNGLILARDLPMLVIGDVPAAKSEDDDDANKS